MTTTKEPIEKSEKAPETLPATLVAVVPSAPDAASALRDFMKAVIHMRHEMNNARRQGAVSAARAFVVLHRLKALVELADSMFGDMFNEAKQRTIPEVLEMEGITNVPLSEGYRVAVSVQKYTSIVGNRKEEAYAWLRENGLADLITSTVNSSTLSAAMRSRIENENLDPPEALFKVTDVPSTSVTKVKKKD